MSRDASLGKVVLVLITLTGAELCIMLALARIEQRIPWLTQELWGEAILDAVLLFCIMAPVFYLLLIRPLQRSNAIKLRFLHMVSDDLRNPINALQGLAMASRGGPSEAAGLAELGQDALHWMQLRVDRVVAFSTLEAGEKLSAAEPMDLAGCVQEARRRFEFMFTSCGQTLEIGQEGPPVELSAVESETLMQLLFSMLEIARMSEEGDKTRVTFGSGTGRNGRTRIWLKVEQQGNGTSRTDVASKGSGPFERIGLARDILQHMAARARCDYNWGRDRTQLLWMSID
jgi:signal transduction histidine kinase